MITALFGTKVGMTSGYDSRGRRVGASVVKINPNFVVQVKLKDGKDGYSGVQLGLGEKKLIKQPTLGHLKKAGIEKKLRFLREVKIDESGLQPGQEISLNQAFSVGDSVKVTGVSKGRGFQGGVRRHGFSGGPKTHGQSDRHRAPGSIGSGTTPGRVYKGKKMAGHMGGTNVSYRGLEVLAIDKENNLLTIKGGVPGPRGGLIRVENIGKIKGYIPPPEEKPSEEEEGSEEVKTEQASKDEPARQPEAVVEGSVDESATKGGENAS